VVAGACGWGAGWLKYKLGFRELDYIKIKHNHPRPSPSSITPQPNAPQPPNTPQPNSAHAGQPEPPEVKRIPFGNVSMFVYSGDDIVSHSLGSAHTWELPEVQEMLWWVVLGGGVMVQGDGSGVGVQEGGG